MHELGIAQGILEIVQHYVPLDQASDIQWVRVRVGQIAGVVADSLDFSFQAIVADTPWQAARLAIDEVPAVANCCRCDRKFEIEDAAFLCPGCGSNDIRMISGNELQVVEIEMADGLDEAL